MHNPLFAMFDNSRPANTIATLAYVCQVEGIDESWDGYRYCANPSVNDWNNGRDRGYIITLKVGARNQLNLAVFEHRNSDDICIVKWEAHMSHIPTIDDLPMDHPFWEDKWAADKTFRNNEAADAANYILDELTEFWLKIAGDLRPVREHDNNFPGIL